MQPEHIGKYKVLSELGRGGMGVVYLAVDPQIERNLAVKVLTSGSPEFQERFRAEARIAGRFQHPNIVTIFDTGVHEGATYLAQEHLDGLDLGRFMGGELILLDLPARLNILRQVADALEYAHRLGVVHRDIKPSNVFLLKTGLVKLMDFGIAKVSSMEDGLTRTGMLLGSVAYMAPEMITAAESVDHRADIWAFGVLAYELLSGRKPFVGETEFDLMQKIVGGELPPIEDVAADEPPALWKVVERCLRRSLDERIDSMTSVKIELDAVAAAEGLQDKTVRLDWDQAATPGGSTGEPREDATREGTKQVDPTAAGAHADARVVPFPTPSKVEGGTVLLPHAGISREPGEALPSQVGRFTLHEFIASGRTGKLYKAYDPVRGRLVGLKSIDDPTAVAQRRLLRGARIWIDLQHPNLLRVLEVDLGSDDHPPLIVTELIDGTDLGQAAAQRRFTLEQKLSIVIQVCDALAYLHQKGVLHREVKPSNILVSQDSIHVTVLDSGIARHSNPDMDNLTRTGILVGDIKHMAPEQLRGKADERSDLFATGAVLYGLLTGKEPSVQDLEGMRERVARQVYPERLRSTLLQALHPDPEARFSRAEEMADQLRELVPPAPSPPDPAKVVATLHGIRTHARWQRAFAEVAASAGLQCRLDRWNFGYFSAFRFLLPWARRGRVLWLRRTFQDEFGASVSSTIGQARPSIVAHSFGTYILGNALVRYPYLRFNKILLCGSILPVDFPWHHLIARGQVQSVRNEYGSHDIWTRLVRWFVPGTGPSGIVGFQVEHERLYQERFDFSHSEYFEKSHMQERWVPFLRRRLPFITPHDRAVELPSGSRPWGLYVLYLLLLAALLLSGWKVLG